MKAQSAWSPLYSTHRDRGWRPGRQRARVDLDDAVAQAHAIGDEHLGERRRGAAVLEPVLIAVPRAGDAAVDDAAFAERAVLVGAQVAHGSDALAVAKDRDALAPGGRDDPRGLVRDRSRRPHRKPAVGACRDAAVGRP